MTDEPNKLESSDKTSVQTIIERFYHWEATTPDAVFLRQPTGDDWKTLTYAQAGDEARRIAAYLTSTGLQPGDHVGILSKNCYHWILADIAILMGGFVSVPYYASLPEAQLSEVVRLSDIKALFVGKLDSWGSKSHVIPGSVEVIKFPHYAGNATIDLGVSWEEVISGNDPLQSNFVPNVEDLWTIKFTSGTTGTPKGVMLSHATPAMIMTNEQETNWIGLYKLKKFSGFSYLPLNHVGERMGVATPAIYLGGSISFAESLETFAKNIQETQPTMFFGVPRIWTKFYLGVISKIPAKRLDLLLRIPIISGIVRNKLRYAMGMQDVGVAATGAAITPAFIKDFFSKLGIHLIEAYGMTEVCGSFSNSPDLNTPPDSVGKPVPGAQVRIDPDTQEILMKTPYIMQGYYKNPEKTEEVLVDGWMHSGDRGTVDENGFIRVTGRVSDAFKTAKGSYVTPNPIEEGLSENEHIEQVCVAGLGIPQPIALINLSEQAATLAKKDVADSIEQSIKSINATRAKFEHVSTGIILAEQWSEDNGLLTPTQKVKRGQIDDRYLDQYLDWHQQDDSIIWS